MAAPHSPAASAASIAGCSASSSSPSSTMGSTCSASMPTRRWSSRSSSSLSRCWLLAGHRPSARSSEPEGNRLTDRTGRDSERATQGLQMSPATSPARRSLRYRLWPAKSHSVGLQPRRRLTMRRRADQATPATRCDRQTDGGLASFHRATIRERPASAWARSILAFDRQALARALYSSAFIRLKAIFFKLSHQGLPIGLDSCA